MLVVISPAKKLDFDSPIDGDLPHSRPVFLRQAEEIVGVTRKLTRVQLADLMDTSDELVRLTQQRFRDFSNPPCNARQAALAFNGDTFHGLDAGSFSAQDFTCAQARLRILSGLYGLLRPLDLIQPYRLEMSARLKTVQGRNLYAYWGESITRQLNALLKETNSGYLLNCASGEYIKVVRREQLNADIITPVFKQRKDGEVHSLATMVKRARGAMARFVIQNKIERVDDLREFRADGYRFQSRLSNSGHYEFHRKA